MGRRKTGKGAGAKKRRRWPLSWSRQPLSLPPARRGTLADRTADAIRRRILLKQVRPGQRVEPMRELARQLGVSLGVVREGIAQLKAEGLLDVRHGRGTFVARRPRRAPVLRAARRRATRRELEEVRRVIEPVLAEVAARRPSERELRELWLAVGERQRARDFGIAKEFVEADLEVHAAVARLSRNTLGAAAYRMASVELRPGLEARARMQAADRRLDALHVDLAEAIDARRPRRARRVASLIAAIEAEPRSPPG